MTVLQKTRLVRFWYRKVVNSMVFNATYEILKSVLKAHQLTELSNLTGFLICHGHIFYSENKIAQCFIILIFKNLSVFYNKDRVG